MKSLNRPLFNLFLILALNFGAVGISPTKAFAAPLASAGATAFDWHTFYGGAGSEGAQSVAVDSTGNIILAAYGDFSWNGPSGQAPLNPHSTSVDMLVVKLDSSGNYLWHTFVGGSGVDYPTEVAVDASGNIFITGYSSATWNGPGATAPITPYTGNSDMAVVKLSSAGAYQWHSFYGGANLDIGQSLAVDSAGNVLIGGYSSTTWNGPGAVAPLHAFASSREMTIVKLNTNGAYQWHTFYGASSSSDEVFGLTIDSADNILVAGYSALTWNGPGSVAPLNPASTGYNIAVMKLNSAGTYQWHTFYGANGPSNDDWAYAVGLDATDNVLVAGYASASWNGPGSVPPLNAYTGSGNPDLMILKLNSAGAYQWHTFYGSTSIDAAYAVTADGDGDIIVAGFSNAAWSGPGSTAPVNAFYAWGSLGEEGTILSLSAAGAYQWHSFYGSDNRDFLRGVAVDASGNYIFAGDSPKSWNTAAGQTPLHGYSGTGWDVLAMKFVPAVPVLPDLSIDDVSIIEGNSGTSTLSFTVTRTGTSSSAVTFNYATADDTATVAGSDYLAASGTGSIPSGGATASTTVSVTINGDAVFENTESFFVNLSAPSNAVITDAQGVGTLTNDDAAPTLAINDVSIVEGNSGTSNLVFTVTRTGLTALPASFTAATADGTATAPSDYLAALDGSTTIAAGGATGTTTLTATVNGDSLAELNETFFVNLSAPDNATIADNQGVGTISNDDTGGISVTQSAGTTTVTEGGATDSYTVVLTSQPTANVGVALNVGTQLSAAPSNLIFTPATWNIAQTVTVTAVDDAIAEGSHSGSISHAASSSDLVYNGIGIASVTATITDNDTAGVTVVESSGSTVVTEGGATDSYTVVLNSQPTANVGVALNVGTQLSAAPSNLTFTPANWNIAQTVTVTAVDDAIAEGSHSGSISHAASSSDLVYDGIGIAGVTATIDDNDTAGITVVASGGFTAVTEGGATDTYTVVLNSQPTANVGVALNVGTQLSAAPSSLTFTAANWDIAQTVTVTATDDALVEGPHNAAITHSSSSTDLNYSAISIEAIGANINDNDSAVVNFAPIAVSQSEATSPMAFTVTLSNPVASGVTLTLNSANGTAGAADFTAISNATVSFAASSTTAQTVNVAINNDALDEPNESFGLALSNLVATGNVTLGAAAATGTIVDDDATPTLSITSPSAPEGNAGSSVLNFVVSLSAISGQDVTFTRATADGSATTANNDYVAIGAALATIPAGQTSLTIPVTINGDTAFEGNETFNVNLSDISNATPGTLSGTGTILEDDQQPTTTTITSDTPDPSVTGQAYTVNVSVAAQTSSPLGTVTISDGSASCGPVALTTGASPNSSASCNLTSTTAGTKTLTASYTPASSAFAASSGTTAHQVNAAGTAISVVGPVRSRINQPTTFTFALSVNAPGGGSPAGTVTLSSGTASCSVSVPTATPSCALTFDALVARTVTAAFAPSDSNYTAASAAGAGNAQTLVYALSDIAVTKTDGVSVYRPGDLIVYTVTVRNNGPDTAVNLRVRDNVPAGLSNVLWSCDASGGVACTPTGGSGNLDVTVASMAIGALLNYTYFGNVSGTPAQIANTVQVDLPVDTTVDDPNPSNNSATDTDLLDALFDNGFEDLGVNAQAGGYRLPSAALRSALDEVAVVVYRLSDANGEALRVYARLSAGQVQYALATRDANGALRLGIWASYAADPSLSWTARQQAAGWVLVGAELH